MKSICIDPGHGGSDNGAAYGYAEEDDLNLSISFLLRCLLQQKGYEVRMTREKDINISLDHRVAFANTMEVDLFISVHCDAWHNETTKGISTHIYTDTGAKTEEVANSIHESLMDRFPDHTNRGVKRSDFCVLRRTRMPAVLIECEFVSNPDMRAWLREPETHFAIANAITTGVKGALI